MKKKSEKKKMVAIRTCIVTRQKLPKRELIRIVRTPEDLLIVDYKGKEKGRGANISPDFEIFQTALDKGFLKRALKLDRQITQDEKEKLKVDFVNAIEEKSFRPDNKPVKVKVTKSDLAKIAKNRI